MSYEEFIHVERTAEDEYQSIIANIALARFPAREEYPWITHVWIEYEADDEIGLPVDFDGFNAIYDAFMTAITGENDAEGLPVARILSGGEAECIWVCRDDKAVIEAIDKVTSEMDISVEYLFDYCPTWDNISYFTDVLAEQSDRT